MTGSDKNIGERRGTEKAKKEFDTSAGKTKSNAIEIPSISLPKGGGAIKGIDEKFTVNSVNGTASFSIPLPFSPARGASPSLSLSYNSGGGNGVFGLGWSVGLSSIKRKTDKEIPQYLDGIDSDTFLFSEAEDLVPVFQKGSDGSFLLNDRGDYVIHEKDSPDGLFTIRYYQPRIEGLFARIERWVAKSGSEIKWRVITRDNTTTLFGWSANSRISDPQDETRIFEWFPEFVFDDKGNSTHYIYKKEDEAGFNISMLHNRNRQSNGAITYTNLYLEKVLYGNKTPYKAFGDLYPPQENYLFSTLFDYGEYDQNSPYENIRSWDFRLDAFSEYKAGFEIRTTRLCKRVFLYHHFTGTNEYNGLVRSVDFHYEKPEQDFTFLTSITSCGYIKKSDGTYSMKKLPSLEFEYQKHEWNTDIKTISSEDLVHAPSGLDEPQYQFTDLFNEGLSGILTEQANGWYYKHNLGDGKFAHAKLVTPKPSFVGLGSALQLADLDGDGGKQLVSYGTEPKGYFELDDENAWHPFTGFKNLPTVNFDDANTRMLDLNGDGKPEILISDDNVFTWYASTGRDGFSPALKTMKPRDEEAGPYIVFADAKQTIFLADMSGDGMTDIVRIRNGEVCYWPNLGYGKFGKKVAMDNAPLFDHHDSFNPAYLQLADIDGSGTTDIIYLGKNKFTCWMNLSGNAFNTHPFEIKSLPEIHNQSKITVTDLLGNGVACIVWSSSLSKDRNAPLKYIDLMNSKKPHILISYKNNLGKEVSLEYTPSTKFYLEDKLNGTPWVTKLHFPVHCISKTETRDVISGARFISSYKYHHGYYDHAEREFRGFGMVEQIDAEHFEHWVKGNASNIVDAELHQEPVVSKTWVHTGAFLSREKILDQFSHDYWYEVMMRHGFSVNHNEVALSDARIISAPGIPTSIVEHLSGDEWQQALRACKGMMLRSEVFAHDAPTTGATSDQIKNQLTPYSVATHNCVIELLQPRGKNRFAVFVVKESESISYKYERNTEDPRIAHALNLKIDEYGNVLESAAVVYPRMLVDVSLPMETQQEQAKTVIIYAQNSFTNDVINDNTHLLRLSSEVKTFELKGVAKSGNFYYSLNDFENVLGLANEVNFYQVDDIPPAGTSYKRLIEHVRTNFYSNDLTKNLPLHQLESLGVVYESYQLAWTPTLIDNIYGAKVNEALLTEGKFTNSEGDNNWWIRSGTTNYLEVGETVLNAQSRFYSPVSYVDPYGAKTSVKYYGSYFLFTEEIEDALGNKSKIDLFNFRTLSPQRMKDINGNLSGCITDELGMVKALAILGKGNEADDLSGFQEFAEDIEVIQVNNFLTASNSVQLIDLGKNLLKHATARFVYDFDVYMNTGKPAVAASILREDHYQKNSNSPIQISFEYSNGIGEVVMKKIQAEPGIAKRAVLEDSDILTIAEVNTALLNPVQLRWIGNGRTILNNKGNPVKQYEPYFSVTHQFEDVKELVETGVTPITYYDAIGRPIKVEMPDDTFTKVVVHSWRQQVYDANDTVLDSSWYTKRLNRLIDAVLVAQGKDPIKEKAAADKAAKHGNTPETKHFDTLGRAVLTVEHNRNLLTNVDEFYHTKAKQDIEGNLQNVTDARGNIIVQYKYDMLGNQVYQNSMDAGQRWLLMNVVGNELRTWDERNHEFQFFYDVMNRPAHCKVLGGDGVSPLNHIYEKITYGESLLLADRSNEVTLQALNVLGRPIKHFDTGGMVETPEYDFKGDAVLTTRKLFRKYKEVANWLDENLDNDLESEAFTFITETNALGKITRQITPDGSIITLSYNDTGLLNSEIVTLVDPATTSIYIKDIDYNEKGQRNKIIYGNDVITKFHYDKETFHLNRLESRKQNSDFLQDWYYTRDAVGNITHIEDKNIPVTFFNNQKVTGISEYTYDALYRLANATGRETDTILSYNSLDNWNDVPFIHQLNPGDPMLVRNYRQQYQYDEVGNIKQMQHIAAGNSWTRNYVYEDITNRLVSTQVGSNTYVYPHHPQHGFITAMPHLEEVGRNFKEELVKSIRQKINSNGTPEITYYQYDAQGQRIRKITENSAQSGSIPTRKEQRIYIAGFETYRTYQSDAINFERQSLSLIDVGHRFAMIETVKLNLDLNSQPSDRNGTRLSRYQLHNHSSSAAMELDDAAQVISYEEYHPYGTTAYQANNAIIRATGKRYRYTGMERDEETGLEYHSARYYIPWLGRWMSCDPIGIADGVNVYRYANNNPCFFIDINGNQSDEQKASSMFEDFLNEQGINYKKEVSFRVKVDGDWVDGRADFFVEKEPGVWEPVEMKGKATSKWTKAQKKYLPALLNGAEYETRAPEKFKTPITGTGGGKVFDVESVVKGKFDFQKLFKHKVHNRTRKETVEYTKDKDGNLINKESRPDIPKEVSSPTPKPKPNGHGLAKFGKGRGRKVADLIAERGKRYLPGVGIAFGIGSAYENFKEGNYLEGVLDVGGVIPGPVGDVMDTIGTAYEVGKFIHEEMNNEGSGGEGEQGEAPAPTPKKQPIRPPVNRNPEFKYTPLEELKEYGKCGDPGFPCT